MRSSPESPVWRAMCASAGGHSSCRGPATRSSHDKLVAERWHPCRFFGAEMAIKTANADWAWHHFPLRCLTGRLWSVKHSFTNMNRSLPWRLRFKNSVKDGPYTFVTIFILIPWQFHAQTDDVYTLHMQGRSNMDRKWKPFYRKYVLERDRYRWTESV